MKRLAMVFVICTLFSTAALAQGRRGGARSGGHSPHGAAQMDEQTTIIVLSALLDLSEPQQKQLREIFNSAVKNAAPILAEMDGAEDALFEAVKAGKNDDQIKVLADREGSLTAQMLALQAQTFAKLFALLDKDQKAQVDATIYADVAEFLSSPQPAAPPDSTSPAEAPTSPGSSTNPSTSPK
jgi:hypothetical protein